MSVAATGQDIGQEPAQGSSPEAFDLIVIGAGPAGGHAALAAAAGGLRIVLLDEHRSAGGQVWREPRGGASSPAPGSFPDATPRDLLGSAPETSGEGLRAALARADAAGTVRAHFEHRVWSVTETSGSDAGRFRVDALGPGGARAFVAPLLVAATGAHERVVPFLGWTLPGVMGLAAATVLLKAEGMAPGRRVVVAGRGPLLAQVAAGVLAKEAEVVAVVDARSRGEWLRALPALARRPALLANGAGWGARILGRRVPWLFGHRLAEARPGPGSDEVAEVVAVPLAGGASRTLACDAVAVGDGLTPGAEVPRLLRARMTHDPRLGGWMPVRDADGETSVPGLFAVGDGAGVRGAEASALAGRLAAFAALKRLGRPVDEAAREAARAALRRVTPFADAVGRLLALEAGDVEQIAAQTVVCRCEDVTRREIEAAAAAGAADIHQLKHFTRCGMGPCQARFCGDVAQALLARAHGVPIERVGVATGRPPLRPVPLGALVGAFDYDEIPIPEPAPL